MPSLHGRAVLGRGYFFLKKKKKCNRSRSCNVGRMADELRALTRLTFEELGPGDRRHRQMHRAIADRAFGPVGPAPPRALHDAISGGVYAGGGAAPPGWPGRRRRRRLRARPLAVGHAARRGRARRPQRAARRRARARGQRLRGADVHPRRRPPGAPRGLPGRRPAPRRLRARAVRDRARVGPELLRRPPGPRPRRHARVRALQQRPPHLRERPLARRAARRARRRVAGRRSSRSRWSGTRWAGSSRAARATRGGDWTRARPPHRLARLAAHWARRSSGRALRERGARRAARDAAVRAASCAAAAPASATCAPARSSTRTGATGPGGAARRRVPEVPLLDGAAHHFVAATITPEPEPSRRPPGRRLAGAAAERLGPRPVAA